MLGMVDMSTQAICLHMLQCCRNVLLFQLLGLPEVMLGYQLQVLKVIQILGMLPNINKLT